jgi:purine-nucleoside phosphorylase
MLADLTRDDWLNILELGADDVPEALIMRGTRNLKARLTQHRELLADVRELGSPNGIFEDILLGSHNGTRIALACVYGAPMASEVAHVFGVIGVSRIILTGCCGALVPRIAAGELIIAEAAFPGDGASRYYGADGVTLLPAALELHRSALYRLERRGWTVHTGSVYTTCALCAESADDVAAWASQGHIAVDMETATVYSVARRFGVPAVAILFTFDCLAAGESIVLADADKAERRRHGETLMMETALELASADPRGNRYD